MDVVDTVKQFVLDHGTEPTYWIAYSGGLDSHVLLHAFAKIREHYPIKLRAVYINHGLSIHAANWALHCAKVCEMLQIHFIQQVIDAKSPVGASPEDTARKQRYDNLAKLLAPADLLLTAHHQDDQAETVLLQLLRGAGPKGLSGMPRVKSLGLGLHGRPFLDKTRAELKDYAEQHKLGWIEDESNTQSRYTRNFLRHEIIPLLTKRWPTVTQTVARSAKHCANAERVLASLAEADLDLCHSRDLSCHASLSVKKLLLLNPDRQSQVLRTWFASLNFPLPSASKMQQILQTILPARADKLPHIAWRGVELRRYQDELYAMPCLTPHNINLIIPWNMASPLRLPGIGELQVTQLTGQGIRTDIDTYKITVRFRQGGESVRLLGRKHHHALKKLMQEWGIPPWQRDRIPLIYLDNRLIAGVGWFVSAEYSALKEQAGWLPVIISCC